MTNLSITSSTHAHAPEREIGPLPYVGGVSRDENRAAHGGCRYIEICNCGHDRQVLINGRHSEVGPWREPERQFIGQRGSGEGYHVYLAPDYTVVRVTLVRHERGRWVECGPATLPDDAARFLGLEQ